MSTPPPTDDLFATHATPSAVDIVRRLPEDWQPLAHGWYRHPLHPLYLKPQALTPLQADQALATLEGTLDWQRPSLSVHGQTHPIPRRQAWMGDRGARYRYSGSLFEPTPWLPMAWRIGELSRRAINDELGAQPNQKVRIEPRIGTPFNSLLANRYADGNDRMGWHSDNEPELGNRPVVLAISLGLMRPLRFKGHPRSPYAETPAFNLWLPHGSLLVMGRGCQDYLHHALPPRKLEGLRISLTYRQLLTSSR
ncbi:alpha-ketoglutarate-dependent dioxygenase AlkB family protein [Cobetia crustatorum]|uniref:alpha-ketoglutarate-dependent dioxygenase AlkB family protein n=1 Tax=Cobetia crustatorum TaxID=553385 RepID=UPI00046A1259|nr:alpha-ketoglutarate-dependent dioxygenase AlkB [Cobetia crustatorum]